jgi:hypothetical protein
MQVRDADAGGEQAYPKPDRAPCCQSVQHNAALLDKISEAATVSAAASGAVK